MKFLMNIYEKSVYLCDLSNLIVFITGITILAMTCVCLFHLFFKKELFQRNLIIAGIITRIIMIISFFIEVFYEIKIYSFEDFYNIEKVIINFLCYGYLLVIVNYYIFTICKEGYKKEFYIFDIIIFISGVIIRVSINTFKILKKIINNDTTTCIGLDVFEEFIILLLILYVFYKMYKLKKLKYYIINLILSILFVFIVSCKKQIDIIFPIAVFIWFLTIYEISASFIKNVSIIKNCSRIILTVLCIISIFSCNPFLNIWNVVEKNYNCERVEKVVIGTKLCSLDEAKKMAQNASGSSVRKVGVPIARDDFNDKYLIESGDYNTVVDRVTNKILEVYKKDKETLIGNNKKEKTKDVKLSEQDVVDKSLNYIKKIGFSYDSRFIGFKLKKYDDARGGEYYIRFYHKYSDGNFVEKGDRGFAEISWGKDGMLQRFQAENGVFKLEDYRIINIDYTRVDKLISNWYKKINKPVPLYSVVRIITFNSIHALDLIVDCNNGDYLTIDSNTCKVVNYSTKDKMDIKANYHREYRRQKDIDEFDIKNMKISKEEALNKVLKKYNFFNIYGKRVKPIETVDKDENVKFKWMVVIIPYKTREHHVYFVDSYTGEVQLINR